MIGMEYLIFHLMKKYQSMNFGKMIARTFSFNSKLVKKIIILMFQDPKTWLLITIKFLK